MSIASIQANHRLGEMRLKGREMIPESSDNLVAAIIFTLVLGILTAAIVAARYAELKRDVLHGRFIEKLKETDPTSRKPPKRR